MRTAKVVRLAEKEENIVRVTTSGRQRNYVKYVLSRLQQGTGGDCRSAEVATITGVGRSVSAAVGVAEIVKRQLGGLHQVTSVGFVEDDVVGVEDSKDDGGARPSVPSGPESDLADKTPRIRITLARDASAVDTASPGYAGYAYHHEPVPAEVE